jgi:hypothetical protein
MYIYNRNSSLGGLTLLTTLELTTLEYGNFPLLVLPHLALLFH